MSTPSDLLNRLRAKRAKGPRCLSEFDSLLDEIEELLENESLNENARGEDPTIRSQMEFSFPEPGHLAEVGDASIPPWRK